MIINGTIHDSMDAWHVLNSDLNKSLGFITPFFRNGQPMWKHLGHDQPARYNCIDADVAGGCYRGTVELLKKHELWKVYQEFIVELDPVFSAMTKAGMPVDKEIRIASSKELIKRRDEVRASIEALAPIEIKNLSPKLGYIKQPKDTTGLQQFTFNGIRNNYCGRCDYKAPPKSHFKSKIVRQCSCGKKWTPKHKCKQNGTVTESESNPCSTSSSVERLDGEKRWAKIEPFVASQKGVLRYMLYHKMPYIYVGKGVDKKPSTDEKALRKMIAKYPNDKFFDLVLLDRELTKILGTYIGYYEDTNI